MAGYGDDTGFNAWAAENGYDVPAGTISAARQRGSAYVDALYGDRFSGQPVGGIEQERAWPRANATDKWGNTIGASQVPQRVIDASYHAALQELRTPGSLEPVVIAAERIKREKVASLEVEYKDSAESDAVSALTPVLSSIEGLLAPLLVTSTGPEIAVV